MATFRGNAGRVTPQNVGKFAVLNFLPFESQGCDCLKGQSQEVQK